MVIEFFLVSIRKAENFEREGILLGNKINGFFLFGRVITQERVRKKKRYFKLLIIIENFVIS